MPCGEVTGGTPGGEAGESVLAVGAGERAAAAAGDRERVGAGAGEPAAAGEGARAGGGGEEVIEGSRLRRGGRCLGLGLGLGLGFG